MKRVFYAAKIKTIVLLSLLSVPFVFGGANVELRANDQEPHREHKIGPRVEVDYVVTEWGDTVRRQAFRLKNDYQLVVTPMKREGAYYISNGKEYPDPGDQYMRLVGNGVDTLVAGVSAISTKYLLRYLGFDFDDYFVLEYSGGGNCSLYASLYEKATGQLVLEGHAGSYDTTNDLMLVMDDQKWAVMLYDLRNNTKVRIPEEYFDDPAFGTMCAVTFYVIEKVTPTTIFVSYPVGEYCDKYLFVINRQLMEDANL